MSDYEATERYLSGEGDSNQLPREDTLLDRGVDDLLDEGYSPPDFPRSNHYGETPLEEEPDVWVTGGGAPRGREPDRAGRLVENDDSWRAQDVYASDAGVAGGAASAEEAAMHIVDLEDLAAETEDVDVDVAVALGEDGEFPVIEDEDR